MGFNYLNHLMAKIIPVLCIMYITYNPSLRTNTTKTDMLVLSSSLLKYHAKIAPTKRTGKKVIDNVLLANDTFCCHTTIDEQIGKGVDQ